MRPPTSRLAALLLLSALAFPLALRATAAEQAPRAATDTAEAQSEAADAAPAQRDEREADGASRAATDAAEAASDARADEQAAGEAIDLEALSEDRKLKAERYPVAQRIQRYLAAAAKEVDAGDPKGAKELLQRLQLNRLNPYERALVFRMLAFIAYGADQPKEAISYFEKFLDEQVLPITDEARVRFNIAQIYASLQEWQKSIDWLNSWLRYVEDPDPLGFYLMAIAYYQLEDFDQAIDYAKRAIALRPNPQEPWIRLLAALYTQKQDYANAATVLEELLLRFPKKEYWVQLSLIYGAHEDYRRSLSVQQVAYAQGFLTEDKELRRLARSYLYHDLPYPAAEVLEKGIKNGTIASDSEALELLANSLIAAREYERALEPLRKAAELSRDGNLYVRLGQVYMQRENWSEAATLLEKAIAKGGLKNLGNAQLLLGIAYYNGSQVARARESFLRAREHAATKGAAERWITHLDTEGEGAPS